MLDSLLAPVATWIVAVIADAGFAGQPRPRGDGGRGAVERWGRYVLLAQGNLERDECFFRWFGGPAVLIARLLPVVRTFIALPVGIVRMLQVPFHVCTFVGSWRRRYALAYVGCLPGERWDTDPRLRAAMHRFDFVVFGILALGFAWFAWRHLRYRPRLG